MPVKLDENLLVGFNNSDDAAVYKIDNERSLAFTVDFFTPVVDDPVQFGRIAAANALSDIYAMGGIPFLSLNIIGFPVGSVPDHIFSDILKGAAEKSMEAGVVIGGGHSVRDKEVKFGQAVIGYVANNEIIDNSSARPGDYIILTKPIGTGIVTTAKKLDGKVKIKTFRQTVALMESLNKTARDIMVGNKIRCATDITGFGLLGHLYEIAAASKISLEIDSSEVPLIEDIMTLADEGFFPGGAYNNHEYLKPHISFSKEISETMELVLCDPQTSGGIAMFVNPDKLDAVKTQLKESGLSFSVIGCASKKLSHDIVID
jgi:selenide,water dikinase